MLLCPCRFTLSWCHSWCSHLVWYACSFSGMSALRIFCVYNFYVWEVYKNADVNNSYIILYKQHWCWCPYGFVYYGLCRNQVPIASPLVFCLPASALNFKFCNPLIIQFEWSQLIVKRGRRISCCDPWQNIKSTVSAAETEANDELQIWKWRTLANVIVSCNTGVKTLRFLYQNTESWWFSWCMRTLRPSTLCVTVQFVRDYRKVMSFPFYFVS